MSQQYPGGFIRLSSPTVNTLSAKGIWTLDQQAQYQRSGVWPLPPTLTTYTFPAGTSTWTAPATTTRLETAVGQGANGVSDSTGTVYTFHGTYQTLQSGTWPIAGAYDGATGYNDAVYYRDLINNSPTPVTLQDYSIFVKYSSATNTHEVTTSTSILPRTYAPGTAYIYNPNWPTSGPVTTAALITTDAAEFIPGGPGAATTGFSLTFPGGAYTGGIGYPASPTTFTNVTITPGATYTIVNNGSLTITYYA